MFYIFYAAAPIAFAHAIPGPGLRVAVVMLIVIAVQPLVPLLGRRVTSRRQIVVVAVAMMGTGSAAIPFFEQWPGQMLLAIGFGFFVVTSVAWVKETAPPGSLGKALGIYGFGSAIGGAVGAPIGIYLIERFGLSGIAIAGAIVAFAAALLAVRTKQAACSGTLGSHAGSHAGQTDTTTLQRAPAQTGRVATTVTLLGHVGAVTIYASVLSSLAIAPLGASIWATTGSAFVVQAFLATGRMIGGAAGSRRPRIPLGLPAFAVLAVSAVAFSMSTHPLQALSLSILVGFTAGICQTAALTSLMSRAAGPVRADRASAAWNICFDIGLGLGALTASTTPPR